MKVNIKKIGFYYFLIVLMAIIIPLTYYPTIYGVDAFQLMWMANALRNGALFSEKTWLINPASYFGYYTFSHRAIGIPMLLAFIMSFLNVVSFGVFGIAEAILVLDIFLIIIMYKCSRNLGNMLFEEEWSRIIFVAAMLLSPYLIHSIAMTVSTRIIITIIMIVLINLNLKILYKSINKFKALISIFLLLLIGALVHRLWITLFIPIIFTIVISFIRKYKKLQLIFILLFLPLAVIAFFIGLEFFQIDPQKIWSPFFDNSSLIGLIANLSINYALQIGLILLFFPVGLIITVYKLVNFLKKSREEIFFQYSSSNQQKNLYLLLLILAFSFSSISYYSTVIFLPCLIIFSVYGLIFIKKYISIYFKKLNCIFPLILLFLSIGYSLLYVQIYIDINLWYAFILLYVSLISYLISIIIYKYRYNILSKFSVNFFKFKKGLNVLVLIFSILIFTTTTVVGRNEAEFGYLTEEEIKVIEFFQYEEIKGLIFVTDIYISERIGGVGFLPTLSYRENSPLSLYYGFISPDEVHENTVFSLFRLFELFSNLFYSFRFISIDPTTALLSKLIELNATVQRDRDILFFEYNIQYIISVNNTDSNYGNSGFESNLIQSLQLEFEPVFSTSHLLVWKIY